MTVLEFTNEIDGAINDFTSGVTSDREFRSSIMDTLIKVASPKLDELNTEDYAFDFLNSRFRVKSEANEFYTLSELMIIISKESGRVVLLNDIRNALDKMNIKSIMYRRPYERKALRGYFLTDIE